MVIKAVIFDIGGVVVRSPMLAIAQYEKENGLPPNYVNCVMYGLFFGMENCESIKVFLVRANTGHNGAFQRFERGEISLFAFYKAFSSELSAPEGRIWYEEYCQRKRLSKR